MYEITTKETWGRERRRINWCNLNTLGHLDQQDEPVLEIATTAPFSPCQLCMYSEDIPSLRTTHCRLTSSTGEPTSIRCHHPINRLAVEVNGLPAWVSDTPVTRVGSRRSTRWWREAYNGILTLLVAEAGVHESVDDAFRWELSETTIILDESKTTTRGIWNLHYGYNEMNLYVIARSELSGMSDTLMANSSDDNCRPKDEVILMTDNDVLEHHNREMWQVTTWFSDELDDGEGQKTYRC